MKKPPCSEARPEVKDFAHQAAGVVLAALHNSNFYRFFVRFFADAKKNGYLDELKEGFSRDLVEMLSSPAAEAVKTQQEMSNYLERIVLDIQNQVGDLIKSDHADENVVCKLDALTATRTVFHTAATTIFEAIDRTVVQGLVERWRQEGYKQKMISEIQGRLSSCPFHEDESPTNKRDLH